MIRRWLPMVVLGLLFAGSLMVAARPERVVTPQARVERIATEVRCPTCKGLSVAQSDAEAAKAAKAFIAEQVAAGRTDPQIKSELQRRYGPQILLRPSARGLSGLVWAVPVAAGVLALAALGWAVQRWRTRPLRRPSDADTVLVARARGM